MSARPAISTPDRNGSIDMTQAVRSPGSALKPFIYGMGFEAGNAHPETLIQDRPGPLRRAMRRKFRQYAIAAPSPCAQALQLSLNIPAVKMLAAVGPARLSARIRPGGFRHSTCRAI